MSLWNAGALVQLPAPRGGHSGRAAQRRRDLRAPAQPHQAHFPCGNVSCLNKIISTGEDVHFLFRVSLHAFAAKAKF